MKKIILTIFTGTILTLSCYSQTFEFIEVNNVRARINANTLFGDPTTSSSSFEVPKGSGIHSIFAASLWLASKDVNGLVKTNINTYANSSQPISGPIMDSSEYVANGSAWDKVWKIQCQEIENFTAWYDAGVLDAAIGTTTQSTNFPGYTVPQVIIDWPAHGDTTKGQAQHLAPFHDRNSDGIYDPSAGDFPLIKGDEAIFFIYNDERPMIAGNDTHLPMKTEVHGLVYGYSTNDDALNNTLFLNYTIHNRSNQDYIDCHIGFWADMDLGNFADDYVASDVDRGSFYTYNGDPNDENTGSSLGYGTNPGAQAVVFLKGAKQDNDGIDNSFGVGANQTVNGLGFGDGIVDNEYWGMESFVSYNGGLGATGSPSTMPDYYNYLSGQWKDGSSIVYGGNGHISNGGTVQAKYMYPGNSDSMFHGTGGMSQALWSEATATNFVGDRSGLGSSGPFSLAANSAIEIDIALVFGRDLSTTGVQAGVTVMEQRIDSIRSMYATGLTNNCSPTLTTSIENNNASNNSLLVYPNPFNNRITVDYQLNNNVAMVTLYNLVGEQIETLKTTKNTNTFDLTNQPNGIYFITITDGENTISKKIVKQ